MMPRALNTLRTGGSDEGRVKSGECQHLAPKLSTVKNIVSETSCELK